MFWLACCIAYFGFLRVNEFTTSLPFKVSADSAYLTVADVTSSQVTFEARFHLLIQISKSDPVGRGGFIYLAHNLSTRESSCSDSILSGGTRHNTLPSICVGRWQSVDRKSTTFCEFSSHAWVFPAISHSFRIGAATVAAAAGLPDHLIQALGR
jgi:hypothetical protein